MADLELTLTWLGMDCYLERFIDAGFDSWETVLEITENDLSILSVDLGHRRKLQREIANTKRLARDPAFVTPLYGINTHRPDSLRGVSSSSTNVQQGGESTKRSYRHHPKPDPKAPERPYSAYVLFSNHIREQLKDQNLSFTDLSRAVGERWQRLKPREKEEWKVKGAVPWEKYKAEMDEYQKSDEYRQYQQYCAEFKASQAARNQQRKPGTTFQSTVQPTYRSTSSSSKHARMDISPTSSSQSKRMHSKVPIKRLNTGNQGPSSGIRSPRVRQACESCRARKIKCYGEQPSCRHCRELGQECYYASGKRDQRRQDDELWQKLKAYEELLLKFVPQVDDDDQQAIQDAIRMPPRDEAAQSTYEETIKHGSDSVSHDSGDESDASGVGSMGPTDYVNHDNPMQQSSAHNVTAFAGQSSDIKWTERLSRELLPKQGGTTTQRSSNQAFAQNVSQALGDEQQPYAEDVDTAVVGHQIDPFSLPVKSTADSLVKAYFSTIHLSFPILDKTDFMDQYDQLYSTMDAEVFKHRTFIAMLQLVFAIAAVHAHLIQADWTGDERDHKLYFSQARVLAVDTGMLNDDCYLGQVQVFGLGGMYLLVSSQLNRAWNLSGLAVRSAQALGLHLCDNSGSATAETREFHAYNWFALMTLESMLALMTGRPSMISPRDCTVTIPRSLVEGNSPSTTSSVFESPGEKPTMDRRHRASRPSMTEPGQEFSLRRTMEHDNTPTAAVYFAHYAELSLLTKEVLGELYLPGVRKKKRADIQSKIERFDRKLLSWEDSVNVSFNSATPFSDPETQSCRVALRILFHNTRITINRPCLCKIGERIQDQSSSPIQRKVSSAYKCVDSARAALNLILRKPESTILHEGTLWWMLLDHVKRALTVLLLELAFRAEHMPSDAGDILEEAKAAVNWLRHISNFSPDARRAWLRMLDLLRLAGQKVGADVSDIMTSSEQEAALAHPGDHQQSPLAKYDNAIPEAFPPPGFHGGATPWELWQHSWDSTAWHELDQFGFLRAEGGVGSLFPTASEIEKMGEEQGEDHDMERL